MEHALPAARGVDLLVTASLHLQLQLLQAVPGASIAVLHRPVPAAGGAWGAAEHSPPQAAPRAGPQGLVAAAVVPRGAGQRSPAQDAAMAGPGSSHCVAAVIPCGAGQRSPPQDAASHQGALGGHLAKWSCEVGAAWCTLPTTQDK